MSGGGEQLSFLEAPVITRAKARAQAMAAAKERAELGMDRAARRAENLHAEWCKQALEALRRFAAGQHGMFLIETAREVIGSALPAPTDARAWGRVVQDAARLEFIEKTKLTAPAVSSNATAKPLWRKGKRA